MKKARSWARRLLEHGLLGDGAGVRGSPDEVLDVRERPPVPHLCTNHEIRSTDDEWRRRRRKQLNHPRMDQQLGPPPPTSDAGHGLPRHGPPILISRLHPRRRPAHSASGSDSRNVPPPKIPVAKPRIRGTHPQEEEETDRPGPLSLPILAKERRAVPMDAEPLGDAEHTNAAARRRR